MKLRALRKGFTLLELMIAYSILLIVLSGLLSAFISCLELNETTRNSNKALGALQEALENLRKAPFSSLSDSYSFAMTGDMADSSLGMIFLNRTNSSYYRVDVGICWMQKNNRVIGECVLTNGTLVFNDANSNGFLDSPVQITTYMAQR